MTDKKKVIRSGRPTADPKTRDLRVRVNEGMYQKVKKYSEEHNQSMGDTVRDSINDYLKDT